MKQAHKTSLVVAVAVIALLSVAFFLVTNMMANSAPELYVPTSQANTVPIASDAWYYVSVADELVYEDVNTQLSLEEATAHCESIAYNPDNMWRQVICVHAGVTIYDDTFVAG